MRISRYETFKRKRMFRMKIIILIVSLSSVFLQTSCAMVGNQQVNNTQTLVTGVAASSNYSTVEKGTAITTLLGNGQIVPTKTTSLYFNNVQGPLDKLNYGINDKVKKGDLFAELKPTDIQNRIEAQRIVVEKGKARLKFLDSNSSDIERVKKSIELAQLQLSTLLDKQKNISEDNRLSLEKAQLALEQIQLQMQSTTISKDLAEFEFQQDEGSVEKIKIKIEQIENEIASAKAAVAQQKVVVDNLLQSEATENEKKLAKLHLEQLELNLVNIEKNKELSQLDLELALATKNTQGSEKSEEALTKSEMRLAQAELALENIQKSIDIAAISVEQTSRSNDEKVKATANDIERLKTELEQLKLQLTSQIKNKDFDKLIADFDQQSAELSLRLLEESLENSKLYSPVDGIVSYLNNFSITDMVGSGQIVAKIADPNALVFQFSAVDAHYVTDIDRAVLTIGVDKYDVEIYKPQPGDSLVQNNKVEMNNISSLYVKFKGAKPNLKFEEIVQAQLEVEKKDVLLVPKNDVRVENGKIFVDLVKGNEIVTTEIIRGIETDTTVEVVNGLKVGDQIVRR